VGVDESYGMIATAHDRQTVAILAVNTFSEMSSSITNPYKII
jgi:hypothetical protein